MNAAPHRPVLVVLTSHWLSMVGVTLVTFAGFSWLFLLPSSLRGHPENPYIGLLTSMALPAVFFLGLILIPIGIALGRKRASGAFASEETRSKAWRRTIIFFAVMTFANMVIGSQVSYRAVEQMETVSFCGQTCHVMKPQYTAHLSPSHQSVTCAECHVVPGATGWVKAKMAGTRQHASVMLNNYPRPVESALASNRLVSSEQTCEHCHSRQKPLGSRLRIIPKFKDDEHNTRTDTVLMMLAGGSTSGGIHGAHLGPGVHIRYAVQEKNRETIPWVEYRKDSGETRNYFTTDSTPESVKSLPVFDMQCADCHNRTGHNFELPERALDHTLGEGKIPTDLPFVKKTGLELLKGSYSSEDEAAQKIASGLAAFYQEKYPALAASRTGDIQNAGRELNAIYQRNIFPDLKVTWGIYPNNLGHTDAIGCFRCHDDSHATAEKKTISQDCGACHQVLAVEETSPEVLKALGMTK
jgi:nitrate/TMAO reductase-like tetraheme cytochrome c subunit